MRFISLVALTLLLLALVAQSADINHDDYNNNQEVSTVQDRCAICYEELEEAEWRYPSTTKFCFHTGHEVGKSPALGQHQFHSLCARSYVDSVIKGEGVLISCPICRSRVDLRKRLMDGNVQDMELRTSLKKLNDRAIEIERIAFVYGYVEKIMGIVATVLMTPLLVIETSLLLFLLANFFFSLTRVYSNTL